MKHKEKPRTPCVGTAHRKQWRPLVVGPFLPVIETYGDLRKEPQAAQDLYKQFREVFSDGQ